MFLTVALNFISDFDNINIPVGTNDLCVQHCRGCVGEKHCRASHKEHQCHIEKRSIFTTAVDWLQKWFCFTPVLGVLRLSAQTVYTIPEITKRRSFVIQMSGANEDSWIDIKCQNKNSHSKKLDSSKTLHFMLQLNDYPTSTDYIMAILAKNTAKSKLLKISVTSVTLWGTSLNEEIAVCPPLLSVKQTITMLVNISTTSPTFLFSSQGLIDWVSVVKQKNESLDDAEVLWIQNRLKVISEPVFISSPNGKLQITLSYNFSVPVDNNSHVNLLFLRSRPTKWSWNSAASMCHSLAAHLPVFLDTDQVHDFISVLKHSSLLPIEFMFIGLHQNTAKVGK